MKYGTGVAARHAGRRRRPSAEVLKKSGRPARPAWRAGPPCQFDIILYRCHAMFAIFPYTIRGLNTSSKDELIVSCGLDCQMYRPLP